MNALRLHSGLSGVMGHSDVPDATGGRGNPFLGYFRMPDQPSLAVGKCAQNIDNKWEIIDTVSWTRFNERRGFDPYPLSEGLIAYIQHSR
jgi:hypothetical protein